MLSLNALILQVCLLIGIDVLDPQKCDTKICESHNQMLTKIRNALHDIVSKIKTIEKKMFQNQNQNGKR